MHQLSPNHLNQHLVRTMRLLLRIIVQYGAFETRIRVQTGGGDMASFKIYE